jgi:hypothetical protein
MLGPKPNRAAWSGLAVLVATAAFVVAACTAPVAVGATESCTRGGAKLVAASGKTRVLRRKLRPRLDGETRREAVLACWAPTGKRKTLVLEREFGDDLAMRTTIEIVGGRYVGVLVRTTGGEVEDISAELWDAKRQRKLHTTEACDTDPFGETTGIADVVFLPGGGMAFACQRLLLFRRASSRTAEELEPAGTRVGFLAVGGGSDGSFIRLYWTRDGITPKSLDLRI